MSDVSIRRKQRWGSVAGYFVRMRIQFYWSDPGSFPLTGRVWIRYNNPDPDFSFEGRIRSRIFSPSMTNIGSTILEAKHLVVKTIVNSFREKTTPLCRHLSEFHWSKILSDVVINLDGSGSDYFGRIRIRFFWRIASWFSINKQEPVIIFFPSLISQYSALALANKFSNENCFIEYDMKYQ